MRQPRIPNDFLRVHANGMMIAAFHSLGHAIDYVESRKPDWPNVTYEILNSRGFDFNALPRAMANHAAKNHAPR